MALKTLKIDGKKYTWLMFSKSKTKLQELGAWKKKTKDGDVKSYRIVAEDDGYALYYR